LTGEAKILPQDAACVAMVQNQEVAVVLPLQYTQLWGGFTFTISATVMPTAGSPYRGINLTASQGLGPTYFNLLFQGAEVPASALIGGLALRSWRPFPGFDGTVTATVHLYTPIESPTAVAQPALPGPPPSSTRVALNVPVQMLTPTHSAQSWHTWPIIIPFDQSFVYTRNQGGTNHALGLWMEITSGHQAFEVDAVNDGPMPVFVTHSMSHGTQAGVAGQAFVLGLLTGQAQNLTPLLRAYGEPSLGHDLLLQIRQAPVGNVALFSGGPGSGTIGACRYLSDGLGVVTPLVTSSMGDVSTRVSIPVLTSLLFTEVYYQAAAGAGGTALSNGVRLTLGGAW
jgi:hypothetical protein